MDDAWAKLLGNTPPRCWNMSVNREGDWKPCDPDDWGGMYLFRTGVVRYGNFQVGDKAISEQTWTGALLQRRELTFVPDESDDEGEDTGACEGSISRVEVYIDVGNFTDYELIRGVSCFYTFEPLYEDENGKNTGQGDGSDRGFLRSFRLPGSVDEHIQCCAHQSRVSPTV